MARRKVIEVVCDRCKKVESQTEDEVNKTEEPEFKATHFDPKTGTTTEIAYADLCKSCRSAVANYFERTKTIYKAREGDEELEHERNVRPK